MAEAADGGVEETKGEDATRQAEAAMKRAAAAAAAAAATTAAAEAVVATPLPSGLPPLPSCGSKHFAIGTVPVR